MTKNFYVKALGFSLCLTIPLLPDHWLRIRITWLTPLMVFVVFPIAGLLSGSDKSAAPARSHSMPWLKGYLYLLPVAFAPLWIADLAWGANLLATTEFSGWQIGGLLFSLAITSAFATCVAHELQHRPGEFDRGIGANHDGHLWLRPSIAGTFASSRNGWRLRDWWDAAKKRSFLPFRSTKCLARCEQCVANRAATPSSAKP